MTMEILRYILSFWYWYLAFFAIAISVYFIRVNNWHIKYGMPLLSCLLINIFLIGCYTLFGIVIYRGWWRGDEIVFNNARSMGMQVFNYTDLGSSYSLERTEIAPPEGKGR